MFKYFICLGPIVIVVKYSFCLDIKHAVVKEYIEQEAEEHIVNALHCIKVNGSILN